MTPSTDEDVKRAAEGDDDALSRLLREIEADLRASVSIPHLHRRELDVSDLLQISYVEAFLRVGSLRERTVSGFGAWMRRLVDTNLKDGIRSLERDKRPDARRRVTHVGQGSSARTLLAHLSCGGASPSAALSAREQVARLQAALRRLPRDYRFVVEQVDLAQRRVAEVAQEMERTPGAVHLLVRRAHDRLREILANEDASAT